MKTLKVWNIKNVSQDTRKAYKQYSAIRGITLAEALEELKPKLPPEVVQYSKLRNRRG